MKFVCIILLILGIHSAQSQSVAGLWRGRFTTNNMLQMAANYKYELLIFQNGNKLSGFSYSTLLDRNFYAVCEIKGTLFDGYMVITETKTVYEEPTLQNNDYQTHILFLNENGKEATGDWKPAKKQSDRIRQDEGKTFLMKEEDPSKSGLLKILGQQKAVVIAPSNPPIETTTTPVVQTNNDSVKLSTRSLTILQTINITSDSIRMELYDDGLIDGDSISVFTNNRLLLNKVALTEKGLKQSIAVPAAPGELLITLFAENEGTIPPNTGVLILRTNESRYEIRFHSDNKQSAAVRIKRQ